MVTGANNRSEVSILLSQAGPEARLAIIACDDAQKSREAASLERARAQKDRLQLLRKGAQKLREMAGNVLWSSIYQGALGAAATIAGCRAGVATEESTKALSQALAKGSEAAARVDPFALANRQVEHEKAVLDIGAEAISHRAAEASDDVAQARQMHSNVLSSLKQIEEAKHRAMLESSKI
jgi:hypothetical protein